MRGWDWTEYLLAGLIAILLAVLGASLWEEYAHPCLRHGKPYWTTLPITTFVGKTPIVTFHPQQITPCLERKP